MDYRNSCAVAGRFVLIILLLYGLILSSMTLQSCHFLKAITAPDPEGKTNTYGVGLINFETEQKQCLPHSTFIKQNYNGMELAAKICAYVAPSLATLVVLWLVLECCKKDGLWGGKCIPSILILGSIACQGLTFLLFQSELFCNNDDVQMCEMGDTGYRSMQACLVYFFSFVLYYCGPEPQPFAPTWSKKTAAAAASTSSSSSSSKPVSEPMGEGDYTKEYYEQRRKEKNIKSRGVSGRKKKEIFDDLKDTSAGTGGGAKTRKNGKSVKREDAAHERDAANGVDVNETSLVVREERRERKKYSDSRDGGGSGSGSGGSRGDQVRYDDYVDEPDGMDWSAYSPGEREAYYEQKRKKRQREKERRREKGREREELLSRENDYDDQYNRRSSRSSSRGSPSTNEGGAYLEDRAWDAHDSRGGDDSRGGYDDYDRGGSRGGYDDYDRGRSRAEYDDYDRGGSRGGYDDYDRGDSRGGHDDYDRRGHDDDYDNRGRDYDSRAGEEYYDERYDDRSYGRDGLELAPYDDTGRDYDSRADPYYDDPPADSDYRHSRSSSSRERSSSRGSGRRHDSNASYDDASYYDNYDRGRDGGYSRRRDDYYGEEPSIV